MTAIPHLARWLTQDQGFIPWERLPPRAEAPPRPDGLDALGVRDHWGSVMTVGLVHADALSPDEIARRAEGFHGLVGALRTRAGALVVVPGLGKAAEVGLGSFGVLLLVYGKGAPPDAAARARALKRGGLRDKTWSVAWVVDVPSGKVYKHGGLPLGGLKPSPREVERALAQLTGR